MSEDLPSAEAPRADLAGGLPGERAAIAASYGNGAATEHSEIQVRTRIDDSRHWLTAIADSSNDAIVGRDLKGVITSWNKAAEAMFGYSLAEIIGQPVSRIVPPSRADEEEAILGRLGRSEKIVNFETKRQGKDGTLIPVSLTVSPIRDDRGMIIGISQIARDLSERDERERVLRTINADLVRSAQHLAVARDAAERSSRAKSHFLSGMSHELRTPLNGILGYAHLLRREGGLNDAQIARVDAMLVAGQHLLEMITHVLDFSEIEVDQVGVRVAELDVHAAAAACLALVRPAAEAKGLTLSVATAPGMIGTLTADPMRLHQVLLNLLTNAVKCSSHGAVELRLSDLPDGSALRAEITDNGPRLSEEQRQTLFNQFDRPDTGATKMAGSTGLSFALSARLVTLMGGRLGHADNPDGGSIVWVELPRGLAVVPPVKLAQEDTLPLVCLNVLVVDDVLMNRDIAASFLRVAGHRVTCVEAGAEAIALVSINAFDVVLMDVRMPDMDGLEATRRIRALGGEQAAVPIVALTAQAFSEQVEECRKAGMDDHLPKPFDPDTLLAAVRRVTAARRRASADAQPAPAIVAVNPSMGLDLLVLDPRTFERTSFYLAPKTVATYLRSLADRSEDLLRELRGRSGAGPNWNDLGEAAHTLAGSAGMFGFERLDGLGRRFARAVQSNPDETPALADGVADAIDATLQELQAIYRRWEAMEELQA